jgi:hypothetical protein
VTQANGRPKVADLRAMSLAVLAMVVALKTLAVLLDSPAKLEDSVRRLEPLLCVERTQNPVITSGKAAVVVVLLTFSTSLSSVWDHGRTADDWPTVKWIRLVRLPQFLQNLMERRRPKLLLNPNRVFDPLSFLPRTELKNRGHIRLHAGATTRALR